MQDLGTDSRVAEKADLARKFDAAGWALFFIWVGIALLMDVGWGVGLLGVGVITLGGQVARTYFGLKMDGFGVVVGLLFLMGGIWELVQVEMSLVPILLIIAGVAILISLFRGKQE